MTRVVHCRHEVFDVRISRPTIWGNPFVVGRDGTRDEVIAKYRAYVLSNEALMRSLPALRGKVLGCWCAPKHCHGDVLVELLDSSLEVTEEPERERAHEEECDEPNQELRDGAVKQRDIFLEDG